MMNLRHWQRAPRSRCRITNCFLAEEGPISELYRQSGDKPIHLSVRQRSPWIVWRDLGAILQTQPFDIVHIFGLRANLLGRLAARLYSEAKVVTGQRNIDSWRKPWHVWADRLTSRWVALYISNSLAGAERLKTVERIPENKIVTIHNGLDVEPFAEAEAGHIRPGLGIGPDALVVVSVANLRESKAQDVLIDATGIVHDRGIPFHLLLVGDGERSALLRTMAQRAGLDRWVHFLGRRTDVPAILADSDIKVLSSRWEGLPGAVMEAMAARLPVIGTNVGGVPELIRNGKTGILVPPEDAEALAVALVELLTDRSLRREMGRAGHQRIVDEFRLDLKVAQLEAVYLRLASGQTPSIG